MVRNCKVRYRGRAEATQSGGTLIIILKGDGTLLAHDLEGGLRPQFYNRGGKTEVKRTKERIYIRSESVKGETLTIRGLLSFWKEISPAGALDRAPRRRIGGREADLVAWLVRHPGVIRLQKGAPFAEISTAGGRADLRWGSTVVEVKRLAGAPAYDQALRYLRDPGVRHVKIVCIRATSILRKLCERGGPIELVIVDQPAFRDFAARWRR